MLMQITVKPPTLRSPSHKLPLFPSLSNSRLFRKHKDTYDEALGEIGNRGESVDAAALALSIDPSESEEAANKDDTAFLEE